MMKHSGHRLLFRLKCVDSKGNAFQKFFEQLMSMYDKTFMPVKPGGPEGDWKCDGYSIASQTVYQCYSPDEMRTGKTSRKIREDFGGAERMWGAKMKRWGFVWNADALPPQVVGVLADLATECQGRVTIEQFGPEKLWDEFVSKFSNSELDDLLGEIPVSAMLQTSQLRLAGKALRSHEVELARELCREVLAASRNDNSLLQAYVEACNLMVIAALEEKDLKSARHHLSQAAERLGENIRPVLRVQFFQIEGMLLLREQREQEAEAAFVKGLDVRPVPPSPEGEKGVSVEELQCGIRADLILFLAKTKQTQRALPYADAVESYVRAHPEAQAGHLLPLVVDALTSLAACSRDSERANRALQLLDDHCTTHELASAAAKVLQKLTGRTSHLGATDIAMACCDLSSRMAQRAELTEDFWAAQFNAAGIYLQLGEVAEAQKRLRTLWPLLDSNDVPDEMKAAFLSLASELASEQGDHLQALELQRKVLSCAGTEPFNQAVCSFHLARKLQIVGCVEEACEALEAAARIGKECDAPGEFLCEVIARWCESETLLGHWERAETLLEELGTLPPSERIVVDVTQVIKQQLDGSKEIRRRIDEIRAIEPLDLAPTLVEANAIAVKPLLDWWGEIAVRESEISADQLSILYDYWGSGGAVEVMSNLRHFAPDHFSPFVEVRSVPDIRRAIRMFSLFSDTLVLLWKGPIKTGRILSVFPLDYPKGGSGYIFALGSKAFDSPSSGPWFPALGQGAFLPEEVCRFLSREAAPLLAQGRLLLLPAPAVGCWQPNHGPCENLLVDLMGTSLLLNRGSAVPDFSVGMVPYFEDAPLKAIADLLGEHPDQGRRLRLALLKRTRELRAHGSPEGASRELRDEITDAFAEWRDLNQRIAAKHRWHNEEDQLAARSMSFQNQWSPVFTLSRLGYRWSVESVGEFKSETEEFRVETGTPFGNWLMLPDREKRFLVIEEEEPNTK
jgi:tetratricopeptide (TPR) repeat protein